MFLHLLYRCIQIMLSLPLLLKCLKSDCFSKYILPTMIYELWRKLWWRTYSVHIARINLYVVKSVKAPQAQKKMKNVFKRWNGIWSYESKEFVYKIDKRHGHSG